MDLNYSSVLWLFSELTSITVVGVGSDDCGLSGLFGKASSRGVRGIDGRSLVLSFGHASLGVILRGFNFEIFLALSIVKNSLI